MHPFVRKTYQGKRPSKRPSVMPVQIENDPFDQLFGPRRSPHPFSSSSEAIPTPSPGPSLEPVPGPSLEPVPGPSLEPVPGPSLEPVPGPSLEPVPGPSLEPVPGPSLETPSSGGRMFLSANCKDVVHRLDSKSQLRKKKIRKTSKIKPSFLAELYSMKSDKAAVPASTPVRRVYRKRAKGCNTPNFSNVVERLLIVEPESPLPFQSPNLSAIQSSPTYKKLRLPVVEKTPKCSGVPQRNPMDSITSKMLQMNLASTAPRDKDLPRVSASLMEDGKSVIHEPVQNMEPSNLQSVASSPFLGFCSIMSTPTCEPPTCESPSPDYVTRRRPRRISGEASCASASVGSVSNLGASDDSEGIRSRLDELDETRTTPSSTVADISNSEDFVIRRKNLQRASDHVTNLSVVSPDGSQSDSLVDPTTSKRLSREDSGSGDLAENIMKKHPSTRDAAGGSVEIPSPDDNRSGIDSSSESLLSRSSRRGSGALPEDVAKRRQTLRTMDPTKRDSGDIASPESSHSGVDSSNESALEEVGISHPKRLSGLKEGSSSGTSSDDFCSMDSVPSSPERTCRNLSVRTLDRSNFRRRSFNESVPSPRGSLREDLMSSSEDENDEDVYGDISSRPSDSYPFYEPSLLEPLHENVERLDDEDENSSLSSESSAKKSPVDTLESNRTPNMRRKASRHSEERSPTGRSSIGRASVIPDLVSVIEEDSISSDSVASLEQVPLEHFILQPGKKYRRSLLIIKNVEAASETDVQKGRLYSHIVEEVLRLQTSQCETPVETPVQVIRKRVSLRRSSWIKQITPPPRRRLTLLPNTPDRSSVTLGTPASFRLPLRLTNRSLLADRTLPRPAPAQDNDPANIESGRDKILRLCSQSQIASFSDLLPQESYQDCAKLGEGVYGEVFSIKRKDRKTVLKIIPVEGSRKINDAAQKTYQEIAPELIIAKELHDLRFGVSNGANKAGGFAEVVDMKLVQGCYPTQLIECWDDFDKVKGSENDRPHIFEDTQQFVVLEQGNAGTALEDYKFQSANTALSLFKQIAFSLAVAESAFCFEHRDLHWGNVLICRTTERKLAYLINSREVVILANGVKGTIIDYTLSRMDTALGPIFNDLSKDPELFIGSGDFQFDVYRHMKKDVNNEWSQFQPKTNARWLYYILDKLLKKKYSRKTARVHNDSMKVLIDIESWIESCNSALEVAEKLAEM